ncbi:MAG: hypothetical protein RL719_374 [Actinomycetota bacterium]
MKRRLNVLLLAVVALSAACSGQNWYTLQTTNGTTLFFTGLDSTPSLGATLLLVSLLTLVAMYIKSRAGAVLYALGALASGISVYQCVQQTAETNLSAVAMQIEKSTGISTWESQRESVVASLDISAWSYASIGALIAGTLIFVMLTTTSVTRTTATHTPLKSEKSKNFDSKDDLWKETSGHS